MIEDVAVSRIMDPGRYACCDAAYIPRDTIYLRDLPKNHLLRIKSVQFKFNDYKVPMMNKLRSMSSSLVCLMSAWPSNA